jgi:hypothetical protein
VARFSSAPSVVRLHLSKRSQDDSTEKTRLLLMEDVAREGSVSSQLSLASVTWQQSLKQVGALFAGQ